MSGKGRIFATIKIIKTIGKIRKTMQTSALNPTQMHMLKLLSFILCVSGYGTMRWQKMAIRTFLTKIRHCYSIKNDYLCTRFICHVNDGEN